MTLQGSLKEFGIVELLQFPYNGRKTCQVVMRSGEAEASLHYDHGRLVHAIQGDRYGEEVLMTVVDWEDGTFEIRQDVASPARTIDTDLHRLIMLALKARDERKLAEQKRQEEIRRGGGNLTMKLDEWVKLGGVLSHLAVMNPDGVVLAQTGGKPEGIEELRRLIPGVIRSYPRRAFKRLYCEDESGFVVAQRLDEHRVLLAVTDAGRTLGAVTLAVNKLASQLTESES
ncbi:MAG: DUF4388 domain-containing protein [Acidobacteriota bacterium]